MNNSSASKVQLKGQGRRPALGGGIHQFVTFTLNNELFGINILKVQEIQLPQPITPVPRAPRQILGLISLRGHVVTVINLRLQLGMDLRPPISNPYHIVITTVGTIACILVDEIGEVIDVPNEKFVAPPESVRATDARFLEGVYQMKQGILSVLNVDAIFEIA